MSATMTLPAVDCAPWCEDGNGHTNVTHPDDQYCISDVTQVSMSLVPLVEYVSCSRGLDYMTLYVQRERDHRHPTVQIGRGDDLTESLTVTEARELGQALIKAADLADQQ